MNITVYSQSIMKTFLSIVLFLAFCSCSQQSCQYADDYIPKDLTDATAYLECVLDEKTKSSLINPDEQQTVAMLHFGLGLQLRNKWGLWKANSRLVEYFDSLGIAHPDDMSGTILTSYYRQLNGKQINLEQQIEFYKDYWLNFDKNNKMTPEEQQKMDSIMDDLHIFKRSSCYDNSEMSQIDLLEEN